MKTNTAEFSLMGPGNIHDLFKNTCRILVEKTIMDHPFFTKVLKGKYFFSTMKSPKLGLCVDIFYVR